MMGKILRCSLPVCLGLFLLAGCGQSGEKDAGRPDAKKTAASQNGKYTVATIDSAGLERLLNERNGKILLLNIWATWCIPCREEFPDLVKLAGNFRNRGVEVVAVSADYPDETESKIIPFLKEQKVNFRVFVQDFDRQEDLINRLNVDWNGALPATFIYDAFGSQVNFLQGKQSYQVFESALLKAEAKGNGES